MTSERVNLLGELEVRRAFHGLAWLAFGNLVVVGILTLTSFLIDEFLRSNQMGLAARVLYFNATLACSSIVYGQVRSWAIIFALTPRRRFIGLLLTTAFAIVAGAIQEAEHAIQHPGLALASLWFGVFLSLGVYAIVQGVGMLRGHRLARHDEPPLPQGMRFGIADLVEWTLTIGIFFGLGNLLGTLQRPALLASAIVWQAIITLPLALAIACRSRRPWMWISLAVGFAFIASIIRSVVTWHFFPQSAPGWWLTSFTLMPPACYLVATACNFAVVRYLGFRLTSPTRIVGNPGA